MAATARRMSLSNVASSRCVQPYRTLVHGPEKVGKTKFFASAPGLIAADVEGRMGHFNIQAYPRVTSWDEMLEILDDLLVSKHSHQNLLIDSASALEKFLKLKIQEDSGWTAIEADEYTRWAKLAVSSYWPKFFAGCERLERERNMGILITCHTQVKSMKSPNNEPYDRFRPALGGEQSPALFLHWAHDVMYACYEDVIRTEKSAITGRKVIKTSTTGNRVLRTKHTPAWDAGNSCGLPPTIPLDWNTYASLRLEGLGDEKSLLGLLNDLVPKIQEDKVREKIVEFVKANKTDLAILRQAVARVREIEEEQNTESAPVQEEAAAAK